jgi:hypothetical protein
MRIFLLYFFLCVAYAIVLLCAPAPDDKSDTRFCTYTAVNTHLGYSVNCDSKDFIGAAEKPSLLLQKNAPRQSRPLYIMWGFVWGYALVFIFKLLQVQASLFIVFNLGFVFLNFLLLLTTVILYFKILISFNIDKRLILASSGFIICNDITRAFFWTAHQQIFNLFTPVLIVFLLLQHLKTAGLKPARFYLNSFVTGVLFLCYGNFLVFIPIALLFMAAVFYNSRRSRFLGLIASQLACIVLFFIPFTIWGLAVYLKTGSFYSY